MQALTITTGKNIAHTVNVPSRHVGDPLWQYKLAYNYTYIMQAFAIYVAVCNPHEYGFRPAWSISALPPLPSH